MLNNKNALATLKAKFQATNPDVLPAGDHDVTIMEMGISDIDSDSATISKEATERGYRDLSFMITVIMSNENGRVMRKFAISGFQRYDDAKKNLKFWNKQVSPDEIGLTTEEWKELEDHQKFTKAFSKSTDGKGYLVYNFTEGAYRVTDDVRVNASIEIFNKFVGGCDPSYKAKACKNEIQWFQNICNDMKGKRVGITVKLNTEGGYEVISKFRTAKPVTA